MALEIGGIHLVPSFFNTVLILAVVLAGLYFAYTGKALRGRTFSAIAVLTGTNVAIFILQGLPFYSYFAVIPSFYRPAIIEMGLLPAYFVHGGQWWAPLTHMFVHANLLHIGFNMLFLWFIGPKVEARIGRKQFVVMYLVAGLGAALVTLASVAFMPASWATIPFVNLPSWLVPNVGASGAVYGVIGFAMGAFPREKVLVPTPIIATYWSPPMAALIIVVLNLFFSFGNTAWWAHLAGMVFGLVWGIRWRVKGPRIRIDSVTGWGSGGPVEYTHTYRYK